MVNKYLGKITKKYKDFYPSFRGSVLNMPNFDADQIEQIAFLIANKTNERFELEIESISLK